MTDAAPPSGCPDRVLLERLASGEDVDEGVALHARSCPLCTAVLAEIGERDRFLKDFAGKGQDTSGEGATGVASGDAAETADFDPVTGRALNRRLPDPRAPKFIGPYALLSVLGEGGFGQVWLAERQEPFVQRVALKLIKLGMDSEAVIARFEQERQALAMMDHPNIARVLDGGVAPHDGWGSGRPYFVMEYVDGETITEYCDHHRVGTRERLEIFLLVCEAVEHAHMKGIIHRDIKPSNILVAQSDGKAMPKIIDFGISKAIGGGLIEKTVFTEQGQFIGTPEYMSPEQLEMGPRDIDTRTDVYSLGVLLYELLAGARPFDVRRLRSAGFDEIRRIIREVDPPKPSDRLTTMGELDAGAIAKSRRTSRQTLAKELKRELDWIPLMAMRKDRRHRYSSPAELARDVRNYLEGQALMAGPESALYRFGKVFRRYRTAFSAGAIAVVGLVLGLVMALEALSRETIARKEEAEHRRTAEQSISILEDVLGSNNPLMEVKDRPKTPEQVLAWVLQNLRSGRLKDSPAAEARLRRVVGVAYMGLGNAAEGIAQLEASVAALKSMGTSDTDQLAETELRLANAMIYGGRFVEARDLARQVIQRRSTPPRPDDGLRGWALTVSGNAELGLGDYAAAEKAHREAIAIHRTGDPGSEFLGEALASLAADLIQQDRSDEADGYSKEALDVLRPLLGDSHPYVSAVYIRLIMTAVDRGDLVAAEDLISRAMKAVEELGPDYSGLASILLHRSSVQLQKGLFDEAESNALRSLEIRKNLRGGNPAEIAQSMEWIARVRRAKGDLAGAGDMFERALDVLRPLGKDSAVPRAVCLFHAAKCRRVTGDFRRADALLAELEGLAREAAVSAISLGTTLSERAFVHRALGNHEEALSAATEALLHSDLEARYRIQALEVRGRVLLEKGDFGGGEISLREAVQIAGTTDGYSPSLIAVDKALLGRCVVGTGRVEEGLGLLIAAGEVLEADRSWDKAERREVLGWVCDALKAAGRVDDEQAWRAKLETNK